MPRPSRIRRIAKWSGVGVCLVLVAAWMVSGTWSIGYASARRIGPNRIRLVIVAGVIKANWQGLGRSGWQYYRWRHGVYWWPRYSSGYIFLPLWMPFLAVAGATAYLFRRDQRALAGYCRKCWYDLTGNMSGTCPECGREIAKSS